jgi:hypothetical protein
VRKGVQVTRFLKRFVFEQAALVTAQLAKKLHTIDGICSLFCVQQQAIVEAYPDVYQILLVFILRNWNRSVLGRILLNN